MKHLYRSVLVAAVLLTGFDSSASLILPDREFSFTAGLGAEQSTAAIERIVKPMGFHLDRQSAVRDDGFFRARFERPPGETVALAGRASCIHVQIFTSNDSKTPEVAAREATEIHDGIVGSLRTHEPNVLLFKSAEGKSACKEPLG